MASPIHQIEPIASISIDDLEHSSKYPTIILETDICKLWFSPQNEYGNGTVYNFHFESPLANDSAENSALCELLQIILNNVFGELELDGCWFTTATGFELSIFVTSDPPIQKTIDFLINRLPSIADITEIEFKDIVEEYLYRIDGYSGFNLNIDDRTMDLRSYITRNHHVSCFEMIPCLEKLQSGDLQRYCRDYFKHVHVEALARGYAGKEHTIDTMNRLLNGVKWGKIDDLSTIAVKTLHLPIGSHTLRCKVTMPPCYNSSIQNFYSFGPDSFYSRAMLDLFMSFSQRIFNYQDVSGISVYCIEQYAIAHGLIGYDLCANFSDTEHSSESFDRFMDQIRYTIIYLVETTTEEEFMETTAELSSKCDGQFYWHQIRYHKYQFGELEAKNRYLARISKAEFLAFLREHCDPQKHRKLSVQLIRDESSACDDEECCADKCNMYAHRIIPKSKRFEHSTSERFLADLQEFKNNLM